MKSCASFACFARRADRSGCHCAVAARYARPPLRVAALRRSSREIVEAARPSRRATSRREQPCTRRRAISSRSAKERYRPDSSFADGGNIAAGIPPAFRNNLVPTACDTPASTAASSLARSRRDRRPEPPMHLVLPPRDDLARTRAPDRPIRTPPTSRHRNLSLRLLRQPFESKQYVSIKYTDRLAEAGIEPFVGGVGDSYHNALAETINGLYKAEVIHRCGPGNHWRRSSSTPTWST
jgi:transposase InsO family protein